MGGRRVAVARGGGSGGEFTSDPRQLARDALLDGSRFGQFGAVGAAPARGRSWRDLPIAHTALGNPCGAARGPAPAWDRLRRSRLVYVLARPGNRRGALSDGDCDVVRRTRAPARTARTQTLPGALGRPRMVFHMGTG